MTQRAQTLTQDDSAAPPMVWDTRDVPKAEAFEFYREGICQCFMPLRPELGRDLRDGFRANVRSFAMPQGALNVVSARSHQVTRSRTEIAASPEPCHYINLQLDGICTINQGGASVSLSTGDVGIFDSDAPFVLDHARRPGLRVASFLVPSRWLTDTHGFVPPVTPRRLSENPAFGPLIVEAARALSDGRVSRNAAARQRLHEVFLSLVVSALGTDTATPSEPTRAQAQLARIRNCIHRNATRAGWSLDDCAAELCLSARYIQRLLASEDERFSAMLTQTRLDYATQMLRDPASAHLSIAEIALAVGFSDPAPFSRAFRQIHDAPPGAWRQRGRA